MRYTFLLLIGLFSLSTINAAIIPSAFHLPTNNRVERQLVIPYEYLSNLKIKEAEKLLGRKLKLKEKIALKAFQWKLKKGIYPGKAGEKSSKGNTSLILGIIAVGSLFIPYASIAAIPCAILAIIFGNQAKKINPNDGQAKAGVILGWVSIGLLILAVILVVAILASGGFWFGG
ncbi:MAG TPA: DUF4190 domain-containing protein [Chitinophagaceae bacterium]|nr:DUF4190 domain-containing protein [Chitinophagaceae bacterium]